MACDWCGLEIVDLVRGMGGSRFCCRLHRDQHEAMAADAYARRFANRAGVNRDG